MIRFENDYSEGCINEILEKLADTNLEQTPGYGTDEYCESARNKIKDACKADYLDVHFLVGGTQVNMTVLDAILRPHQGVVSPVEGHVNVHEAGAIEGRGHKVITLASGDEKYDEESKLKPQALNDYLSNFFEAGDWHMVQPGAVYISHPTERGALYSKDELVEIKSICDKFNLPLFIDGARLSYALAADENDISLEVLAKYSDVFYIGGTKCGALFGEAICFTNDKYNKDFRCIAKHNGAVLAKGRLLGLQFDVLFTDNLYVEKSRDAYKYAIQIKQHLESKNVKFLVESFTNQQFPLLNKEQISSLDKNEIAYIKMFNQGDHTAVRICTNWATKKDAVDKLLDAIK